MAVFEFHAVHQTNPEHHEHGTVVADDKLRAWDKLTHRHLTHIQLKRLNGFRAMLKQWRPDVA